MKKNFSKKFNCSGFTLSEVLVITTLFMVISGVIFLSYSLSNKAYRQGENSAEIIQNGRVIIERISREIRQAKEIVGDFPEEREDALEEIIFEDGHIADSYHYIHYYKLEAEIKREVVGYYFSGDADKNFVPWDAIPPAGQTLQSLTLEESKTIGEWVSNVYFWGLKVVNISLILEKQGKETKLETKVFGRNI